jgi:hypothetical protein
MAISGFKLAGDRTKAHLLIVKMRSTNRRNSQHSRNFVICEIGTQSATNGF